MCNAPSPDQLWPLPHTALLTWWWGLLLQQAMPCTGKRFLLLALCCQPLTWTCVQESGEARGLLEQVL